MCKRAGILFLLLIPVSLFSSDLNATLKASLDQYDIGVVMEQPTVLRASLKNNGTATLYFTGLQVLFSAGASGEVYNPDLLKEKLHKLDPGQSWGGPLAVVRAKHRGPLAVKGSILIKGGTGPSSSEPLASLPIFLTINDPKRRLDGSYDRDAVASCDRQGDSCCDPSEEDCFIKGDKCFYVAEGYSRQQVCVNQSPEKSYDHISDLKVSLNGEHFAYIASLNCRSYGGEVHCKKRVVVDHAEQTVTEVPTQLVLSKEGTHFCYLGRTACVTRGGQEVCTGSSHIFIDGRGVTRKTDLDCQTILR